MVTGREPASLPIENIDISGVTEPRGQPEIMLSDRDAPLAWLADQMGLFPFLEPVIVTPWLDSEDERLYQVVPEYQGLHDARL